MSEANTTDIVQEKVCEVVVDLINKNVAQITAELLASEEGKLSVSMKVNLTAIGLKLYVCGGLTFSRKFTDEAEVVGDIPDPNQPQLIVRSRSGEEEAQ